MRLTKPGWTDSFGLILIATICYVTPALTGDPGFGWHLSSGEWISENQQIPHQDHFLEESKPWVNNQWLADLLLFKIFSTTGFPGLHLLALACFLITYVFLISRLLLKNQIPPAVLSFVVFLTTLQASVQWFLRPVIFSFLFFALLYSFLVGLKEDAKLKLKDQAFILILFAIWANIHPGFLMGILLIGIFIFSAFLEGKKLAPGIRLLIISMIAMLANPYFLELPKSLFALTGSDYFMNLNAEWLSVPTWNLAFLPYVIAMLLFLALLNSKYSTNVNKFLLVASFIFLCLSLFQRRIVPFFGIVSSLTLALMLGEFWKEFKLQHANELKRLVALEMKQVQRKQFFYSGTVISFLVLFVVIFKAIPI